MPLNHVKTILNTGKRINSDSILELIESYPYISFDIFDTLVKRNLAKPTDVFTIMEKTIGAGFKEKRIEAENRARIESGKTEVTIEDIYSYFPEADRQKLIELELTTEKSVIVPNSPIASVYKKCLEAGKTIYVTSDMYWPEKTIRQLLEDNGFVDYKALYLSSKEQKVKSDGSLFVELLKRENINGKDLVHIGDSRRGDYQEPRRLGISAIHIPRFFKNVRFRGDERNDEIGVNYLNHFINNTFPYTSDPYYQFGYSQFGKLLFGYVHWIHDEAIRLGINKLFFFSRDGYIMKQSYDVCFDDSSIETRYLEVSRRSLRGPILWMDCSCETVLKMVVNAKLISLTSVLDGIGLEIGDYKEQIEACGLELDSIFDRSSIYDDNRLKTLLESIRTDIVENSKKEYELLTRYLKENAVTGRFAVIDIGYGGSMQRYLQQVLSQIGIEYDITGFYLAVADFYTKNMLPGVKLDLNGYLFDFQHDKDAVDTRSSFVGLLDSLFLEQGGSVKRYYTDGDKVYAERYPYEYEVDGILAEDLERIRRIQAGAMDFVNTAAGDKNLYELRCDSDEYYYGIHEVGVNPTKAELKLFGDIHFYDEGIIQRLAAPKSVWNYLFNPRGMKKDFLQSRWKIGLMKRLLKINLPYQKVYNKLRKIG